ncbi:MAG: hypothetical protein HRF50_04360 [Phycisphaerae bacterium]|jgi:hypothetical protein
MKRNSNRLGQLGLCGKLCFCRARARYKASRARSIHGQPVHAYHCVRCHAWHLGSLVSWSETMGHRDRCGEPGLVWTRVRSGWWRTCWRGMYVELLREEPDGWRVRIGGDEVQRRAPWPLGAAKRWAQAELRRLLFGRYVAAGGRA